jgi:hypothetical protein
MADLSAGAKKMLRHLKDNVKGQGEYEYPATLEKLFGNAEECEAAQAELEKAGLLVLGTATAAHIPVRNRIRSAALTLDGERFLQNNTLD